MIGRLLYLFRLETRLISTRGSTKQCLHIDIICICADLLIPLGTASWHCLCVAWCFFFSLSGYFQQPQGETVTDATLLCPTARRACGMGVVNTAKHLAVTMETAAGRGRSFEFDYLRMKRREIPPPPVHQWNPMCPMWLSLRYGNV